MIIVVGSTMIDMMTYVERVPAPGETVVGNRFEQGFGGKGANQAVMASRLGASVSMVNCLGDDVFGDMTLDNLAREGIDTSAVTRAMGVSSGVAPIWVEADGTNRIIVVPGANDHLTPDAATRAIAEAPAVHVVLGQFEVPQAVTTAAFATARRRGAETILNPAPAAEVSAGLLAETDWLIPNEVEFAALRRDGGADSTDLDKAIVTLAAGCGVRLVVTMGAAGAAICEDGDRVLRVPSPVVDAVDTTGAGDAFVGAFAYGRARGLPAALAAELGCRCASLSVTRRGTQTSLPSVQEAREIRALLQIGD